MQNRPIVFGIKQTGFSTAFSAIWTSVVMAVGWSRVEAEPPAGGASTPLYQHVAPYAGRSELRAKSQGEGTNSAEGDFALLARSDPVKKSDSSLKCEAVAWGQRNENIKILMRADSFGEGQRVTRLLHKETLEDLGSERWPVWDDSVESEVLCDLRAEALVLKNLIPQQFGGHGYIVNSVGEAEPRMRMAVNELNDPASFAVSPDGRFIAFGGRAVEESVLLVDLKGKAKVWESLHLPKGNADGQLTEVEALAFSENGRFLASLAGKEIAVRESEHGKIVGRYSLPSEDDLPWSLCAVGNSGQNLLLLEGRRGCRLLDIQAGRMHEKIEISARQGTLSWTPDCQNLAVIGVKSREADLVGARSGKVSRRIVIPDRPAAQMVSVSTDGTRVVVIHRDDSVTLWGAKQP